MKLAFLNLQGAPRGNFQLASLIKAGFVPSLVIEEASKTAERWRAEHVEDLQLPSTHPVMRPLGDVVHGHSVEVATVQSHNDERCERLIRQHQPDLIVLGETRIIRSNILRTCPGKILNTHPGFIPNVRGNDPVVWAAKHDLPQGCTVHVIDEGVDTGPIVLRRQYHLSPDETLHSLMLRIDHLCADLLPEAVKTFVSPGFTPIVQEKDDRPVFRAAPIEVKRSVIRKLQLRREAALDRRDLALTGSTVRISA